MTYYDLMEYYNKEHNECGEIKLISISTGDEYIFRRYQEMFTNRFLWANILTGYIYLGSQIIKHYELPVIDIYEKYKNLETGTIIQVKNKYGDIEYYKKTYYDDKFIECDINGYIKEPEIYSLERIFETFETVKVLEQE